MDATSAIGTSQPVRGYTPRYYGGGGTTTTSTSVSDASAGRKRNNRRQDPCLSIDKAFMACVGANSCSVGACQFYYEALHECKQQTSSAPSEACARDLKTFTDCVNANSDRLSTCQIYFDMLHDSQETQGEATRMQ